MLRITFIDLNTMWPVVRVFVGRPSQVQKGFGSQEVPTAFIRFYQATFSGRGRPRTAVQATRPDHIPGNNVLRARMARHQLRWAEMGVRHDAASSARVAFFQQHAIHILHGRTQASRTEIVKRGLRSLRSLRILLIWRSLAHKTLMATRKQLFDGTGLVKPRD